MKSSRTRSLTSRQSILLLAIYSLRFSTRSILSQYLGIANTTSFYSRLKMLQNHGYIATRYDASYRLAGRAAEYYLLPKGLRALRSTKRPDVSDAAAKALHKDSTVGPDFIAQQLMVARLRNALVSLHDHIQAFTGRDIQPFDYFPTPPPNLLLSIKNDSHITRILLDYIPALTPDSTLRKRLGYLTRYYNEGRWDETGTDNEMYW